MITDQSKRLYNGEILHPNLPDPTAGWDFKPKQTTPKPNSTENNLNAHINGFVSEIQLANRVADDGYTILKWGDKTSTHGSDIVSIDPKTQTVVLWDNKFRSNGGTLEISPTFDINAKTASGAPSGAWANARNEAINTVMGANLPNELKQKTLADLRNGKFETRTVGSGALEGQTVIQKYANYKKVD